MEAEKQSVSVSNKPHKDLKCEITPASDHAAFSRTRLNTSAAAVFPFMTPRLSDAPVCFTVGCCRRWKQSAESLRWLHKKKTELHESSTRKTRTFQRSHTSHHEVIRGRWQHSLVGDPTSSNCFCPVPQSTRLKQEAVNTRLNVKKLLFFFFWELSVNGCSTGYQDE